MRTSARADSSKHTAQDDPRGAESDERDDHMLQNVRQLSSYLLDRRAYEIPTAASDW